MGRFRGQDPPSASARTLLTDLPPLFQSMFDEAMAAAAEPLIGITETGTPRPGLFGLGGSVSTAPILEAALSFNRHLSQEQ